MRNSFADEITKLAAQDERVFLLSGDIGNKLFNTFKEQFPTRFKNCGVAEANMIGVGAGLALSGMRPIAYTITPFMTARCYEQIKLDVCYHNAPMIITGVGAGLSYASLGPTHHTFEDIGTLRLLPNLTVICPGDAWEVRAALRAALRLDGPVYLRIGKKNEPVIHKDVPEFRIGKAIILRPGKDVCLLGVGTILPDVLAAADLLAAKGISAAVLSFHTVKPLDDEALLDAFAQHRLVVTVEEHGLLGGAGSAVAEWMADHDVRGVKLLRFGIRDEFLHEAGNQRHARDYFGLAPQAMAERILKKLETL